MFFSRYSRYAFLSDYLTDLTQGRAKKLSPVGFEPLDPLDHHCNALPTELGRNLLCRRFLK